MAQEKLRRSQNIDGDLFVDSSCIDCDACRWIASDFFKAVDGQSAVYKQPESQEEKVNALQALVSCPTASIGYLGKDINANDIKDSLPILVEDNVYYCGYSSEKSYGAASYFIKDTRANILIDSPRFTNALVERFEELGGIDYILLTHKDDVADHEKFQKHFKAKRLIHEKELCKSIKTAELLYEVDHHGVINEELNDLVIIPTPGHTEGHLCFLYKNKFLFTGDHIAYSARHNKIVAFENYCWYSWDKLLESVEKLIEYKFEWILPGHGRRIKSNPGKFKIALEELCSRVTS